MDFLLRLLRFPFEVLVAFFVLIDETARPLYRPVLRWIGRWRFVARFEQWVATQPRFLILALLVTPFIIIEPLKIVGLFWIARGAVLPGAITLGLAYLTSFVLVERIYRAGEAKLMTFRWFARLMRLVAYVRETLLRWVKQTAVWRLVVAIRVRVRNWLLR